MTDEQNWRTEIDAEDYFRHQKKKTQVADRRPVIRKASDLVGPGIDAAAVVVTDWNDVLATFNGYFSSTSALNGPQSVGGGSDTSLYVGFVTMDATYGGKQIITDLNSGLDYTRIFRRAPTDPNTIVWGPWVGSNSPDPTAFASQTVNTSVPVGTTLTPLNCPVLSGSNWEDTYEQDGTSFNILRDGVYTGVLRFEPGLVSGQTAKLRLVLPQGLSTETRNYEITYNSWLDGSSAPRSGGGIAFTFVILQDTAAITASASHSFGFPVNINWIGLDITRTSGVL